MLKKPQFINEMIIENVIAQRKSVKMYLCCNFNIVDPLIKYIYLLNIENKINGVNNIFLKQNKAWNKLKNIQSFFATIRANTHTNCTSFNL